MQDMASQHEPGTISLEDGRLQFAIQPDRFWQGIRTALVSYIDGDKGSMGKALFESLGSFSKTHSLEHKAFRLIYTALHEACTAILTVGPEQERLMEKVPQAGLRNAVFQQDMSLKLGGGNYAIDAAFFSEPHRSELLQDARADYRAFLQTVAGLGEKHADALAAVLPGKFVRALAVEWEQGDYAELLEFFKNPFLEALRKLAGREARHAALLQRFAKPAFNDPRVTLAEMYIEPEFWVHGSCIPAKEKDRKGKLRPLDEKPGRHNFFEHADHRLLHPFFLNWVKGETCLGLPGEKDGMLILLGQPGQGKSSAFLRTIDQLLREHPGTIENVFLVRLRDIIHAARLVEDPLPEICKHLKLDDEADLKNSLLLLDGLDELYMSQGLALSQIHDFVRILHKQIKSPPLLSLRIALTSRTNYLKFDDLGAEDYLIVHLADLSLEQQQEWLRRYRKHYEGCVLTEAGLGKIAEKENKAYDKIRELINQPILLQMIAASGMPIDEKANSALIYRQLFDKMIKRDWSPDDGQLDKFKKLTEQDLRRFLQTLALHIFQKNSGHEYARRADFEQEGPLKDETGRLARKLGFEKLPLKELVKDLLVSFYFQEVQRDTEEKRRSDDLDFYAYEFLHKSLQEYLVAENIWNTCFDALLDKDKYGDFKIQKTKEVYELIAPLFERKVLTQEIADYLHEIAANDDRDTEKTLLRGHLKQLFPGLLRANFLLKHEDKDTEPPALDKMLGNFFGFWSLASALITQHDVDPRDEKSFQAALESNNFFPEAEKDTVAHFLILLQRSYFRTLRAC
jgi:hypothetical protein